MDSMQAFSGGREIFREIPPGLPLLFQFPRLKSNYRTAYVGAVPGEALILRLPLNPGITQLLTESYSLVVRFVHDGQAYGFESHFLTAIRKPLPLLFVTFPNSVRQAKLRGCERLAILEKAELISGEVRTEGLMTDVSCGGCKIKLPSTEANRGLAPGGEVEVDFAVSMEERVRISLKGLLLEVENEGKKLKCRVAFHTDQAEGLAMLGEYLQYIVRMLRD